jgi:hypothetical protein
VSDAIEIAVRGEGLNPAERADETNAAETTVPRK